METKTRTFDTDGYKAAMWYYNMGAISSFIIAVAAVVFSRLHYMEVLTWGNIASTVCIIFAALLSIISVMIRPIATDYMR